jgi:proline dehydrogenase
VENDVPVMVDAEETWMQKAVDDLLEELMYEFNKKKPYVITTLQMYRKDRFGYLQELFERTQSKNVKLGIKFVRGAYMEKERERAEEMGYPSPVCDTKEETDRNYNNALKFMMDHIQKGVLIYNGSHNEESNLLLANLTIEKGLPRNDPRIWFGQLYGMSDNITFNLAKLGFNASKYIPFGPVKDVMPYLIRRAEENTSVAGQTSRELRLLEIERKRRKLT